MMWCVNSTKSLFRCYFDERKKKSVIRFNLREPQAYLSRSVIGLKSALESLADLFVGLLRELKRTSTDYGLAVNIPKSQLYLRFNFTFSSDLQQERKKALVWLTSVTRSPIQYVLLFGGKRGQKKKRNKRFTFGSWMKAWPFLEPGGILPVVEYFRHSMMVWMNFWKKNEYAQG